MRYSKNEDSLLNLTVGFGEDANIYRKAGLKMVVGIDPHPTRISVANSNVLGLDHIKYIVGNSNQKIKNIVEFEKITTNKFDVVSVFFELERFFEKEKYFQNLMDNASLNLKTNGFLILAGFDGEKINEVMNRKTFISGKYKQRTLWTMQKDYLGDYNINKPNFNKYIKLTYSGKPGIRRKALVNMDYIVEMAPLYKLKLVEILPFKIIYDRLEFKPMLSRSEKELCFYNTALIFKKLE